VQLVANAVRDHGLAGLAIATICCGAMQMTTGALKLGGIVKLTPAPVMTGFMTGIGMPPPPLTGKFQNFKLFFFFLFGQPPYIIMCACRGAHHHCPVAARSGRPYPQHGNHPAQHAAFVLSGRRFVDGAGINPCR
jgi:hypothetical protein